MAYSAEADLNLSATRLVELTDSDSAVGVKNQALVDRLQARATARVNASLYGKYTIDPNDFPPILTQLEADLWRFYLYEHREIMSIPDTVKQAHDAALKLLENYRTGDESLAGARTNAATEPTASGGSFSSDSEIRVFGRAKDGLF